MEYSQFRQIVSDLAQGELSEHEVITVARQYQDRRDEALDLPTLVAIAQEQLSKVNFDNFNKVIEQCVHYDKLYDKER